MTAIAKSGLRAILFLRCPHTGITQVSVAKEIDPKYDLLLKQACDAGVEILCYRINISEYDFNNWKAITFYFQRLIHFHGVG